MADHTPTGPVEMGAEMDYPEHEKTYSLSSRSPNTCSLVCVALLVAMAFGFFTSAGFFSATVLFFVDRRRPGLRAPRRADAHHLTRPI